MNSKRTCLPPQSAVICDKCGVSLTSREIGLLKIVGCDSYNYDSKGITDLERSMRK
jgi:hypothetical protein